METEAIVPTTTAIPEAAPAPAAHSISSVAELNRSSEQASPPEEGPRSDVEAAEAAEASLATLANAFSRMTPDEREALSRQFEDQTGEAGAPEPEISRNSPAQAAAAPAEAPAAVSQERATNFRVKARSEVEARALRLLHIHKEMTLEEALMQSKRDLGIPPSPVPTAAAPSLPVPTQTQTQPQGEALPASPAELKAKVEQLMMAREAAAQSYNQGEQSRLDWEITRLTLALPEVMAREQESRRQSFHTTQQAHAAAVREAAALYPEVSDHSSELFQHMVEIDEAFKNMDDERYYEPDKYLKLAKRAAAELDLLPASVRRTGGRAPASAPTATTAAPRPPTAQSKYPVAPIGSGQRQAADGPNPLLDFLNRPDLRPDEYEVLVSSLLSANHRA